MARDTSNDPVVNLPLAYKFDGNGNIIQKVFFGVNAVFGPVWYWWYFKSNRDPNFWLGDSEMDGYDPDECSTEFQRRMDNFTPEESCNLFEVAKYCDRMTGVTVFDVVNGRNVNERHLDDYYTGYDLGIEDDDEDEEDDTDIEMEFEGQPVSPQPMRVCDEGPCQFMLPPVLNCGTDDGSGYEVEIPLRAKTTKSGTPQERLSFYIPADVAVQWFREVTDEPQADYQLFQTVWMDRANRLENPHFIDHLFSYAFW